MEARSGLRKLIELSGGDFGFSRISLEILEAAMCMTRPGERSAGPLRSACCWGFSFVDVALAENSGPIWCLTLSSAAFSTASPSHRLQRFFAMREDAPSKELAMSDIQNAVPTGATPSNNGKPSENQASEPTIIAEQHRTIPAGATHIPSGSAATNPPPAPPEQPGNPNPPQQPQYPADPMDPSDPHSPNPIEGRR